jgi:anti-sigma factor RsiW
MIGWRGRLSALAAAALFVIVAGGITLPIVSGRSTILLAAQLALDHLKCFTIEGDGTAKTMSPAEAQAELQQEYGWSLRVSPGRGEDGLRLVGVRRCLYGDGRAAHLTYRAGDQPVSLFIIPGLSRPPQELSLLGHDQIVWNEGGNTFMLIGRSGGHQLLQRVASQLSDRAK